MTGDQVSFHLTRFSANGSCLAEVMGSIGKERHLSPSTTTALVSETIRLYHDSAPEAMLHASIDTHRMGLLEKRQDLHITAP